ncbi:TolC family protein [Chondromyces apiculatus]|uniref:Outer membrane efflux protein n=1 Tax=Chondromyces apiculatus DSM 436 TaxID=1192034 RepID=A0A017T5F6_9BACT|nr:TolC family protein [Chondromyces apiculatus]EYF03801.1 Hypothetical protein CAP_5231 [Chondromyces apiculatus DSM 436]
MRRAPAVRWFLSLLSCTALFLLDGEAREARADPPLTLEEAIKQALTYNERSLQAPLRVEAAEGQVERARAAFLPSLSASGAAVLNAAEDFEGRHLSASAALTVNQPIINPSAFPSYAQARHSREAEKWGAVQDRRVLAFDTARAFLVVLTSERLLSVAERRLERAKANQQNAQARTEAQLASSNDATRSLIETASSSREVVRLQGTLTQAYLNLGFLVGKPVTGPLATPERTTRAARAGGPRSSEEIIRRAEQRRPDLRAAEERTAALEASAEEPLYRLAPTLGASGQLRVVPNAGSTGRAYDLSAQLNLNWTIYDAGARYADRKTRVAQAKTQALAERQLRRSVAVDLGLARASLKAAREAFQIAEQAVVAARANSSETEILYQQGLARAIELVDANASRYEAEVNLETARLAMEQAYLELRYALGLDPLDDQAASGNASNPPAGGEAPAQPAPGTTASSAPATGTPATGTPATGTPATGTPPNQPATSTPPNPPAPGATPSQGSNP